MLCYLSLVEEREEDGNESGINVVYLDKDMTFEMVNIDENNSTLSFVHVYAIYLV